MTEQTGNSLGTIRGWCDQYRDELKASPLQNINQLSAKLDMTHAHPSGVAQLFASGQAPLKSLFRDSGKLTVAGRGIDRVLADCQIKQSSGGVAGLSIAMGVAVWSGTAMPVLLYPVSISKPENGTASQIIIRFDGDCTVNGALVAALREQGINISEKELLSSESYEGGSFETSAVFRKITNAVGDRIEDFDINRQIILGCFMEPSMMLLNEAQNLVEQLENGQSDSDVIAALAGNVAAAVRVKGGELPKYSPFDIDPHYEYEAGDVDNAVRYASCVAASGRSLVLDVSSGDSVEQALGVVTRCVMSGRSVLYAPGNAAQKQRFMQVVSQEGCADQVLDVANDNVNTAVDQQLRAAIGFEEGTAGQRFDQLSDELVGVRSRLLRYLNDLHGSSKKWNVSMYEATQNLARISALPTRPATHVRLSEQTALNISGHLDEWAQKLRRAGELGEYELGENDTAWYKATITSEQQAVDSYNRADDLMRKVLPATREHVAKTVETCGFPVPSTAHEWEQQVTVLKNMRRVLDVFQPEIFERDINPMIEATAPKSERKAQESEMGFWERRRHVKEAKRLLRAGAQVEDMNAALKVVAQQGKQWRQFVPHGGWPVLPTKLDDIVNTQETLSSHMTALDSVLASTPQGDTMKTADLNDVETRLKSLLDDQKSLDTLPERCRLEQEFTANGLDDLVADLTKRKVKPEAVDGELQLAWWSTVFEDIVRSSEIISNQDGSALQSAADRFAQVDVEHVRSVGPMVAQEGMRRLHDLLYSHQQETNQMHTLLAGKNEVSLNRVIREYRKIFTAAKPILVASPGTLAMLTEPTALADIAVIDACSHISPVELLAVLRRAKSVVIIAHSATASCDAIQRLARIMPTVTVPTGTSRRAPRLEAFLDTEGYGTMRYDVATESAVGTVQYHRIEASGVPVLSSGLVESSQQEIDEVVRLITERASAMSMAPAGYVLAVVTLTDMFRSRLGEELRSLAGKDEALERFLHHVRIVPLNEVNGAHATDVILALNYAKTVHGRLIHQFGVLEGDGGRGLLLDALAMPNHNLDIVSTFGSSDLDSERLHRVGPKFLKSVLAWAEQLDDRAVQPATDGESYNVLITDLAERLRARGMRVALNYGFDGGTKIPMVVGRNNGPFVLAIETDDNAFMQVQSMRQRHRINAQNLMMLGWSVMGVWSVAAFVNPDKEVDRIVSRVNMLSREAGRS